MEFQEQKFSGQAINGLENLNGAEAEVRGVEKMGM